MMAAKPLLLTLVAASMIGKASAGDSVRSKIQTQYKRWVAASMRLDVDGVLAILTPDYTLKTFDGKLIPLKMYEQSLRKRKATGQKPNAYTTTIQSLEKAESAATVISWETSVTDTPDPITNKIQKVIHVHQYRDIWTNLRGTWKLASTVTLLEKTTIGKTL